jgi:hypothetical protein
MPVRLNGATSGYTELSAPAVAGITTMTMPTASGTLDRLERAGNILQVVSAETSTEVTNSLASFEDTGLSATITPTSVSSKILIMIDQQFEAARSGNAAGVGLNVVRNSTTIHSAATAGGPCTLYVAEATQIYARVQMTILDSPASTSAVTYKTQGRPSFTTSSGVVNFQKDTNVDGVSRLILMEVAG